MYFYLIELKKDRKFYFIAKELHRIHETWTWDNDDIDKNEVL